MSRDRDTFGTTKVTAIEWQICKHGIHKVLEEIVAFCPTMTKEGYQNFMVQGQWQDIQDTLGDLLARIDSLRQPTTDFGPDFDSE